ncbi:MAG: Crp/Fnr family transcriptional regulator [Anaerolineae bacterium]|nr:Crp/Fnr family transcriptional regulator [Anaerolineae bacterium]
MTAPYNTAHLAQMLGTVPHFRTLSERDLETIVTAGHIHRYAEGAILFHESAPCAGLYVLIRGEVQLRKLGPDGREQIMSVLEPVIMFNEVPVLDDGPNVATAVASRETIVWKASCSAFQELLHRYPEIGLGLLRILARRNRFLISQYEDLSFRTVIARTAKLLLVLGGGSTSPIDRNTNPNTELAARIATVPEAFSRALRLLRQDGLVACTRETITLLDPQGLKEIAEL